MKSILDFAKAKNSGKKITMVTCYDSWSAKILTQTRVDCLLVGDSVAMTLHGHQDTLHATVEMMASHVAAARRGAPELFIVGDMPFLAHRGSFDRTLDAARMIITAGANALKIEGVTGSEDDIKRIVESGVPVMGHLGLTPQSVHQMGGYKVQGVASEDAKRLLLEAKKVQAAGCFAVVLECVPAELAKVITDELSIPTIGIGAGANTSGQVLVFQDLLGFNRDFKPKFVRRYVDGFEFVKNAVDGFVDDVEKLRFPTNEESYT